MDAQEQLPTHVPSVVEVVEDNILIEEVRSEQLPTPSQTATSPAKASPSSPAKSLLHGFSSRQGTYKLGDKFIHLRDFRIVLKRLDKAFVYAALGKGPKSKRRRTSRKSVTSSPQGTKGIKARPQRQTSNTEVSTGSNDVVSRGMARRPRSNFKQSTKSTLEGSPRNMATQYPLVDAAKQTGTTGSPLIQNKSPGISSSTPNNRQDSINNRPSLDHDGASRLLQALGLKRRGVELEITPPQSQVELTPPNPATGIELWGMNKPNKPLSVPAVVNISGGRKRSNEAHKSLEAGSNKPVPQFTCYSCLNVFNNQYDFNSHRRQHVDDKCRCEDCGEDMETYFHLKRHVLEKIKAGKLHLKPPNHPPHANQSPPVPRRQVLKSPSNVLKPQNPPPPPPLKRRSVHTDSTWTGPSDMACMNSKEEHRSALSMTSPDDVSDPLELYPPHFMQSFMEIDSPKKEGESQQNPKSTDPLATSASQSRPVSLMTTQTGSKSRRLSGEILIIEERSGPFASDSPVREKPRVPTPVATYKLPSITSGPALPTISVTQSKSSLYGLPGSTSRATGRSLMTFSQTGKPLPSLNDVSIVSKPSVMVLGGDGEYSTYEELLEPLAKMKNFALAQKDGSILFTVHELEKHIMTTILSEGRDGGL